MDTERARCGGGTLSLGGDASEDFTPFLFTVGDGKALRGIEDGVRGMRQGGVRRLVLPLKTETALAYTLPIDKSPGARDAPPLTSEASPLSNGYHIAHEQVSAQGRCPL